jgi:hypothetical protein
MKDISWTENPLLKDIDPRKMEIITELITETKGKSVNMAMPALMKANNQLKSEGMSFTNEESALIMELLTKDMSPEEKIKLEKIKLMLKKLKK